MANFFDQFDNEHSEPQQQVNANFFDQFDEQPQQEQQPQQLREPTMLDNAGQAARGLVNIPFDVLQGGASLINAISQGLGGPKVLDDVYRPVDRPTDKWAQAGEEVGGYLLPGIGTAGNMVIGSLSGAGNEKGDFAENAAKNAAINLGVHGALAGAAKVLGSRGNMVAGGGGDGSMPSTIPRTNEEVVNAAKTKRGRSSLHKALDEVSPDLETAAKMTGVDISKLTPGQRSANPGLQDVEGVLSSVAGKTRDAQERGFLEVADKLKADLKLMGAEAGTSSEKTSAIRERVVSRLNALNEKENTAWANLRNVSNPSARERAANARSQVMADESLSRVDDTTVKKFFSASNRPMTFQQMKEWRGDLSDSISAYLRAGKNHRASKVIEVRKALTEDMRVMAEKYGFKEDWQRANDLSSQYFSMRDATKKAFGDSMDNDQMINMLSGALRNSAENGMAPVHKLVMSLPEGERSIAVASSLLRAIEKGAKGGESVGSGVKNFADILTPQNMIAVRKYLPNEAELLSAYGALAKDASAYLKRVEYTGRSMPSLKRLESNVAGFAGKMLKLSTNRALDVAVGATAATSGGSAGVAAAAAKHIFNQFIEQAVEKKSVKFMVEKAISEGRKAIHAGGSNAAFEAAERRLLLNPNVLKVFKEELPQEVYDALRAGGVVATVSGLREWE